MSNYLLKPLDYVLVILISSVFVSFGQNNKSDDEHSVVIKELLKTQLEVWNEGEVIVTYFEVPAGYKLKKHYHPGEEFAYIIDGSGTVWFKNMPEVKVKEGEIVKIPLNEVHTVIPGPDGMNGLVFRVHKKGEPLRINVE